MKDIHTIQIEIFQYILIKYGEPEIQNIEKLKGYERVNRIQHILQEARLLDNVPSSRKDMKRAEELRIQGNDLYKQKKLKEALHLYTESLFTAPLDSPEYYLALSNRSAVLVHLSNHLLALKDAKTALELINNNPTVQSKLKIKLKTRIDTCEIIVQGDKDNKQPEGCTPELMKYFRLRDPRNPKIPCASDKLKLLQDDKFGRAVVATSDLKPGHVIAVEKPYCHDMNPSERLIRCAQCLSSCVALQACPGCTQIGFCSEECHSASEWHNYECPITDRLYNMKFPLLVIRIITTARCDFPDWKVLEKLCDEEETKHNSADVEITRSYGSVHRLRTHEHFDIPYVSFHLGVYAAVFHYLLKTETKLFTDLWNGKKCENFAARLILRHGSIVPTNAYGIHMYVNILKCVDFANGVYPFLSMLNHSCCPNADITDFGTFKVLKVLRPIKKNQQIFIYYGPHYATDSKNDRLKKLKFQYQFTCECQACSENWPQIGTHRCFNLNTEDFGKLVKGDLTIAQEILEPLYKHADRIDKLAPSKEINWTQDTIQLCMFLIARYFGSKYIEE